MTDTKSVQHQQAGEGRAGHEGPLKQAIFKICSKHPDPRLEDVLEFLQGFIDESLPEKFMDEFHRPESPIPINPQEITPPDWQQHSQRALLTMKEARLSYRSLDGTQADCSIKTIANYVTEYRRSTR